MRQTHRNVLVAAAITVAFTATMLNAAGTPSDPIVEQESCGVATMPEGSIATAHGTIDLHQVSGAFVVTVTFVTDDGDVVYSAEETTTAREDPLWRWSIRQMLPQEVGASVANCSVSVGRADPGH